MEIWADPDLDWMQWMMVCGWDVYGDTMADACGSQITNDGDPLAIWARYRDARDTDSARVAIQEVGRALARATHRGMADGIIEPLRVCVEVCTWVARRCLLFVVKVLLSLTSHGYHFDAKQITNIFQHPRAGREPEPLNRTCTAIAAETEPNRTRT
jgi:hypothetical protein